MNKRKFLPFTFAVAGLALAPTLASANAAGHTLVKAQADGTMVLASLPDGHYTVKATHDGKQLTRNVTVQQGKRDTVLLEWPE